MFHRLKFRPVGQAWSHLWFRREPTSPLELIRMGLGAALLLHYALAIPYLHTNWGEAGWYPLELAVRRDADPWVQSVFFYFTDAWQLTAFYLVFLLCCAALMVGWRTCWVKWIVLIGHISFAYRNINLTYGVDGILSSLLFLLCIAPIGRVMSLDRLRTVQQQKRKTSNARRVSHRSSLAFACKRLMQIQMAVLFFFSATSKIREDDWWAGDAVWRVFARDEYYNSTMLDFFSSHFVLVPIVTYGILLIEMAFPFLIWQRATRPWMLAAAISLHLLIFFFLGLHYFSFVMIMGHVSFVRPEWIRNLGVASPGNFIQQVF